MNKLHIFLGSSGKQAPQLWGTGEIKLESADRALGYWITRGDTGTKINARTSGIYLRADPEHRSS
jgi:hypothetical protein